VAAADDQDQQRKLEIIGRQAVAFHAQPVSRCLPDD
jgi:hypothetical protein